MIARTAAVLFGSVLLTAAATSNAQADDSPGGWTQTGSTTVSSLTGGEGVASMSDGSLVYRGLGSIPLALRAAGWNHVGDPDAVDGYVFDAYQGGDDATSKMFAVTTPGGDQYTYTHALDSGEALNNSFATVSPDKQWLVSGEWGDMNRLQVFPAPLLNSSTPATGGDLAQAPQISLDHPVNDIQGCDFVSDTRLVCVSDDSSKSKWPDDKPLLQVDLDHPLDGTAVNGHVTDLLAIPQDSACSGTYEAEGIDYDTSSKTLRVEIVPPGVCEVATTVYSYAPAS